MRGTRGTETSKYPEEETSTEIPLVVASERGGGQTESRNTFGVRTAYDIEVSSRSVWESTPKKVRVL